LYGAVAAGAPSTCSMARATSWKTWVASFQKLQLV